MATNSELKAEFRAIKAKADAARDEFTTTCPASRHAYLMAKRLVTKAGYEMLSSEPIHCAESIMSTVASLWEARSELATQADELREAAQNLLIELESNAKPARLFDAEERLRKALSTQSTGKP